MVQQEAALGVPARSKKDSKYSKRVVQIDLREILELWLDNMWEK